MRILLRTLVLLVTLFLMMVLYGFYYNIDGSNIRDSINSLFGITIVVHSDERISKEEGRILTYSFDSDYNHYQGQAVLEQGILSKYRIVSYDHVKDQGIISVNKISGNRLQIRGVTDTVDEIVVFSEDESLVLNLDNLHENKQVETSRDDWLYYEISEKGERSQYGFMEAKAPYIYKGDTLLIYLSCGMVFMFGFMTFSMFSKETNLLEGLFVRVTRIRSKSE